MFQVQYEYQYKVDEGERRGPVMDRWERRLGEYVKGAYSVLQPDGSVRTVDYEVDGDGGYHAVTRLTPPSTFCGSLSHKKYINHRNNK